MPPITLRLLGVAPKACPVCGAAHQACGSPGHRTSIRDVTMETAGGNLIADEAIWVKTETPGVLRLAYAPGDVIRPADRHLVAAKAAEGAGPERAPKPRDKALRGPREKAKE